MSLATAHLPGWCNPEAVYVARDVLLELYSQPPWAKDGLCKEYPKVNFFPGQGGAVEPAKSICAQCIVRAECLAWAVERDEAGIWGGTSQKERRMLGRALRTAHALPRFAMSASAAALCDGRMLC